VGRRHQGQPLAALNDRGVPAPAPVRLLSSVLPFSARSRVGSFAVSHLNFSVDRLGRTSNIRRMNAMAEPQTSEKITVYLLDDHEIVRLGLRDLLESDGDIEVIGESGSVAHGQAQILALRPQVAVLDGRLPDGSGIDVCREIRSRDPGIAALILTSFDDDEALFAAIMAGAAGYVLKQIRGSDLIDSVRRVAAGQSLLDPAVTARVLERVRRGPELDPALSPLTDQERRVLSLIGEGMTNRQIAEAMFLAEKTVKNYVSSLLAKLGLQRRTQAALFSARHPDAR